MPGFSTCLIIVDIWQGFEYATGITHATILNMQQYSYNKIIIFVTNIATFELFSLQFVHSGAQQLTILSFSTHVKKLYE